MYHTFTKQMLTLRFLLARLRLDSLLDTTSKREVKLALKDFERGSKDSQGLKRVYDQMYSDALKRIEAQGPGKSALAKKALSWLTYAQRLLTTFEISHALAVEPGDDDVDADNVRTIDMIVSVCAGLATVDLNGRTFRLVHYTAQEYFERIGEDWNPLATLQISTTCIRYLSLGPFRSRRYQDIAAYWRKETGYHLMDYASQYWNVHAHSVPEQLRKDLQEVELEFLSNDDLVSLAYLQRLAMQNKFRHKFGLGQVPRISGLHYLAILGEVSLLKFMVSGNFAAEIDSKDKQGRTTLSYATEGGSLDLVKFLVERNNYSVGIPDQRGRTPLFIAASLGHEDIVKYLLSLPYVDPDSRTQDNISPLSEAAWQGHEALVQIFLAREDVDPDPKDTYLQTPLSRATSLGHFRIVETLLSRDEVVADCKDRHGRTPLSHAAGIGHDGIVRALLSRNDVIADDPDRDGRTPLSHAASGGHVNVVKLLLSRDDVDADSRNKSNCTPLHFAARDGRDAIVEILLAQGNVSADARDNNGLSPLAHAIRFDELSVVEIFADRKDINFNDLQIDGRSALSNAFARENHGIFNILMSRTGRPGSMYTLPAGTDARKQDSAETLLSLKPDSKDSRGRTPLLQAVAFGDEQVFRALLTRGSVRLDSKDNDGCTSLHLAARANHASILKLLGRHNRLLGPKDVDFEARNNEFNTPLLEAVKNGCYEAARELIHENAKMDVADKNGTLLAVVAEQRGDEWLAEYLNWRLDEDAKLKGPTNTRET
jgi:ankyrin repeat protein